MRSEPPAASIRTEVDLPLRLPDGFATIARAFTFDGLVDGLEHLALRLGGDRSGHFGVPLVRLHSECLTGDLLGSLRCDCGPQLLESVRRVTDSGGYLLYLRQEGRGIGLYDKLDAYVLQDTGLDTYQANLALGRGADERDYRVAAQMLRALDVDRLRLLSNNPDKARQLVASGLEITEQVPTAVHLSSANAAYLACKAHAGAHRLDLRADRGRDDGSVVTD